MTLVGDIAQATGAWAHDDWEGIVEALSDKSGTRFSQLTVGYRLPQPTMDVANRLLRDTQFGFNPPIAVREVGDEPPIRPCRDSSQTLGHSRRFGQVGTRETRLRVSCCNRSGRIFRRDVRLSKLIRY